MSKLIEGGGDGGEDRGTRRGTAMGRALDEGLKLQAITLPEVRQAWKQDSLDLAMDADVREATRGGALRDGNLLNAWALWVMSRPEEERKRIAIWGLRALERLKDSSEPIDLRKISREYFGSLGADTDGYDSVAAVDRPKGGRMRPASKARGSRRTA